MRQGLEGVSRILARITEWVVILMAFGVMGSLIVGVFFRYVLGTSLSWSGELAMFFFTWLIFLAGSLGVREGFHTRLVFVRDLLPPRGQLWLEALVQGAVVVFGLLIIYTGLQYVERTMGQVSAAVQYPIEALNASAVVGGILVIVHGAAQIAAKLATPVGESNHD